MRHSEVAWDIAIKGLTTMEDVRVIVGSGNVYVDFGDPDAEEKLAKVRLAMAINQVIARRRLTQTGPQRSFVLISLKFP